jgi:hypothetical protein
VFSAIYPPFLPVAEPQNCLASNMAIRVTFLEVFLSFCTR